MAQSDLGTKRVCVSCGARFYDLARVPAVCPKCDAEQPAEQPRVRRAGNPVEAKRPKAAVVPGLEDGDVEVEVADDDADEDLLDDSDIDDEAEAIVDVEVENPEEER